MQAAKVKPETDVAERVIEIGPTCCSLGDLKRRLLGEGYSQVNANLSEWRIRRKVIACLRSAPKVTPDQTKASYPSR